MSFRTFGLPVNRKECFEPARKLSGFLVACYFCFLVSVRAYAPLKGLDCYEYKVSAINPTINNLGIEHHTRANWCYKLAFSVTEEGKTITFSKFGALAESNISQRAACESYVASEVLKKELADLGVSSSTLVTSYCGRTSLSNTYFVSNTSMEYDCSRGMPAEVQGMMLKKKNTLDESCKKDCVYKGLVECQKWCGKHSKNCKGFTYRQTGKCSLFKSVTGWGEPGKEKSYVNSCRVVTDASLIM